MKILISAGDASGDLLAALLAKELKASGGVEIWALGGPELKKEADVFIEDLTRAGLMGWIEPVLKLPYILNLLRRIRRILEKEKISLVIPVDFYGFNIRLAQLAKSKGLGVTYYVSPQIWASRQARVQKMRRFVDKVLCLFPFETAFYSRHGVSSVFVGHPLSESLTPHTGGNGNPAQVSRVGLMPGSRRGEIQRHMPVLIKAWKKIKSEMPDLKGFLYQRGDLEPGLYPPVQELSEMDIEPVTGPAYPSRAELDLVLAASGMAALENMLLGVPQVVFYGVKPAWVFNLLRRAVKTPYMAMPNILAHKPVVPEYAWGMKKSADEKAVDYIVSQALRLLNDEQARRQMRREMSGLGAQLRPGKASPSQTAAKEIINCLAGSAAR